jgi:hypothetical protein
VHKTETRDVITSTKEPRCFFEKQLVREEPLSFEMAERLCGLANEFSALHPWEILGDQDLILMEDPQSQQICYCSIMGALCEVFSLHVYVGAESYRLYRKIAAGKSMTAGDFFASQRGVFVEFVKSRELTPPDREVLRAFNYPTKRDGFAPIFRALRPGYHPWYATEHEGRLLARCMQAVIAFFSTMSVGGSSGYWDRADVYPFLVPTDEIQADYKIKMVKAPEPPIAPPQVPEMDETLLTKARERNFPVAGALEVDHFFGAGMIGGKHERKACFRTGLATDARSGFVFQPELGSPQDSTGEILLRVVLNAVLSGRFIPQELRVRHQESQVLLEGLARRLGSSVRVVKKLPALDHAKNHLLSMMGDAGVFMPGK